MKLFLKFIATSACLFAFFSIMATPAWCEDMSPEKVRSYQFAEYFSHKDLKGMASLLGDDIIVYDPDKITKGKENFLELLKNNFDKTKIITFRINSLYQQGTTTIFEFELSFDDDKYKGVDIVLWENNEMKEIHCYYNPVRQ